MLTPQPANTGAFVAMAAQPIVMFLPFVTLRAVSERREVRMCLCVFVGVCAAVSLLYLNVILLAVSLARPKGVMSACQF